MIKAKALFLDRDGVINRDDGYVHVWDEALVLKGVVDLITRFRDLNFLVIILTNQSGIGRGYYDENKFNLYMLQLKNFLGSKGAHIDSYYYCKCDPTVKKCVNRKPNNGMFLDAIRDFNIHPELSVMVGDKLTDMIASKKSKITRNYLFSADQTSPKKIISDENITVVRQLADIFPN